MKDSEVLLPGREKTRPFLNFNYSLYLNNVLDFYDKLLNFDKTDFVDNLFTI
jgi:hypothetical protein